MKVVAIIQARIGSTRLPGKVLRILGGRTVLAHVIQRALSIPGVDEVIVATTKHREDDQVAHEATRNGAEVFRGSELDVLDRYFRAASESKADVIIRITSDCPLLDPLLVGAMLKRFLEARASGSAIDYMSNGLRRTYPRGLDAEIFTMAVLEQAHKVADKPYEREHVTPYVYEHPKTFRIYSHESKDDLSYLRWTLDTEKDLEMLTRVFEGMQPWTEVPATAEVLAFLQRTPEVASINADIRQKVLGE